MNLALIFASLRGRRFYVKRFRVTREIDREARRERMIYFG
jgi:hypothetical protein